MNQMTVLEPIVLGVSALESIDREIAAGRWQNAAKMAGRNQHSFRMERDVAYRERHLSGADMSAPDPEPAVRMAPKAVIAAPKPVARVKGPRVSRPAPREWVEEVRARMKVLGWNIQALANAAGMARSSMWNAFGPNSYCSDRLKWQVESALDRGERGAS